MIEDRDVTAYALGLLTEELGELIEALGKAQRFGLDTPGVDGSSARQMIHDELGDILAAMEYGCLRKVFDRMLLDTRRVYKLQKLLNPDSKDNLGRRLAP